MSANGTFPRSFGLTDDVGSWESGLTAYIAETTRMTAKIRGGQID